MVERLPGGRFLGEVTRRRLIAGLSLSETRYAPGTRLPPHRHEQAYLCLVRRGTYCEEYAGLRRACGPLTVAFHPAAELHAEDFGGEVWSFNVEFPPPWLRRAGGAGAALDRPLDSQGGPLAGLALRLFDEFEQPDEVSPLVVEGLALELLGRWAREVAAGTSRAVPPWLRRVRERLEGDYAGPPCLTELAADAGVHPGHLAAAFRRHFGCTAGEYVRRQRVAAACRRLTGTDLPLAAVALEAGFADQSHFTRTFRRHLGLTPAEFCRLVGRPRGRSKA
jgi:AraC family transcriptional regulator